MKRPPETPTEPKRAFKIYAETKWSWCEVVRPCSALECGEWFADLLAHWPNVPIAFYADCLPLSEHKWDAA